MTRVGETVGGEVLRHVIHETLVVHRACAAVGVEADGVREGDEGALCDEVCLHPADGDGAAGSDISMAFANGVVAIITLCGGDSGHAIGDGDVAARGSPSAADAGTTIPTSGRNGATADGDVAARGIPSAADARTVITASGRDGAAANGDVVARGSPSAADAGTTIPTSGRNGATADGDVAARRCPSAADARCRLSTSGCDGAAADGDVAARKFAATADARRISIASGRDGASIDGNIAARGIPSAADAHSIFTAIGRDGAATDGDVAAGRFVGATDACSCPTASDVERAAALEGEGLVFGYMDAGTSISSLHVVVCVLSQNDDGIAQAGDAWPLVVIVFEDGCDVHAAEGHRGAIGNENMGVGTTSAGECVAVMEYNLSRYRP